MPNKPRLSFSHMTVEDDAFALADGVEMGVKVSLPAVRDAHPKPPLIFLHGSFHSAWCWVENFLPYFAERGYPCLALSLRGTHETPVDTNEETPTIKVKIERHVEDVLYLLQYIRRRACSRKITEYDDDTMRLFFEYISGSDEYIAPVLIAHSFGGLTAMKLLEKLPTEDVPLLSTMALLCSVPPSGIMKMSLRAIRKNPVKGWRIMKGLAMKRAVSESKLCRLLFFDKDVPDEQLTKYQAHFQEDSKVTIDLGDLSDKLPILGTDGTGCSTSADKLKYPGLALGGSADFIVDNTAVAETAKFLGGGNANIVEGAVHDVMLSKCWRDVAEEIEEWLDSCFGAAKPADIAQ